MGDRHAGVLGGSVAGLSAALLLARDGHRVTLIERDRIQVGPSAESPNWERRGIPHFLQPHAFMARGRLELLRHLPDVHDSLVDAGAQVIDFRPKLPGEVRPGDDELQFLGVRRPLIEWALRRAVLAEPRIEVRDGATATGLAVDNGRIKAVHIGNAEVEVDLVVDAGGRRTPTPEWTGDKSAGDTSDCGVIYYSRYYRLRDGHELPDGPWFFGPRGDLGYMAFSTFPGDNRTFAGLLAGPPGVPEWRGLKQEAAFESAVASIPALRNWVDADAVEPITDVLTMAGLRNSIRSFDPERVVGLVPVGDALGHTDPVLAHGLSFAVIHAVALAAALREHADVGDAASAYVADVMPALRERFALASGLDDQRFRMWLGETVDMAHHDGAYELFSFAAAGIAALVDADTARVFIRRLGLLDSTAVLDQDLAMQRHIESVFQEIVTRPRPPAGPSRDAMAAVIADAVAGDPTTVSSRA